MANGNNSNMYTFWFIVILFAFSPSYSETDKYNDNGVIFEDIGTMQLVTSFHNLVIPVKIANITHSIQKIISMINGTKNLFNSTNNHFLGGHYDFMINNIINQFEGKQNLIERYMKAFNNFSQYSEIMNKNFKNIVDTTQSITLKDDDDVRFVSNHISLARDIKFSKLSKGLVTTNLTYGAINNHVNNNKDPMTNVSRDVVMATSLTFYELALKDLSEEIEILIYTLDSVVTNRKTSVLVILPELLLKLLLKLQDKTQINLVYPASEKYIPKYYAMSQTYIKFTNNTLYYIVRIPLKLTHYELSVFKLHFLHLSITNLPGWSRKIDSKMNYLAYSSVTQQYLFFNHLSSYCIILDTLMFCDAIQENKIYKDDDCLVSLYKNYTKQNCMYVYQKNRKDEFIKIKKNWIGSIFQENKTIQKCCLDTRCENMNLWRGVNIIPIYYKCDYKGEHFVLPRFEEEEEDDDNRYATISGGGGDDDGVKRILKPTTLPKSHPAINVLNLFNGNKNNVYNIITSEQIHIFNLLYFKTSKVEDNVNVNFCLMIILYVLLVLVFAIIICYYRSKRYNNLLQIKNGGGGKRIVKENEIEEKGEPLLSTNRIVNSDTTPPNIDNKTLTRTCCSSSNTTNSLKKKYMHISSNNDNNDEYLIPISYPLSLPPPPPPPPPLPSNVTTTTNVSPPSSYRCYYTTSPPPPLQYFPPPLEPSNSSSTTIDVYEDMSGNNINKNCKNYYNNEIYKN